MTGEDIITHFRWLVDDDGGVDSTQEVTLLNEAYDLLCILKTWVFLRSTHTSNIITAGDTTYALPTDFLSSNRIVLRESSTSDNFVVCKQVPFEERLNYIGDQTKYYIDLKNSQVVFCEDPASYSGWQMVHEYQYQPAQLSTSTSPVFNRAFHTILAYEMAKKYYFNDQGEKSRSWNSEMEREYNRIFAAMMSWDGLNQLSDSPSARPFDWAPELRA